MKKLNHYHFVIEISTVMELTEDQVEEYAIQIKEDIQEEGFLATDYYLCKGEYNFEER